MNTVGAPRTHLQSADLRYQHHHLFIGMLQYDETRMIKEPEGMGGGLGRRHMGGGGAGVLGGLEGVGAREHPPASVQGRPVFRCEVLSQEARPP